MQEDKKKLLTKMIVSFLAVGSLYYGGALDRDCFAGAPANSQTGNNTNGEVRFDPTGGYERVYGWYLDSGDVEKGHVTISEGSNTLKGAYGGFIENGNANNNTVTVNGGQITMTTPEIYGGYSNGGSATGNRVVIDGNIKSAFISIVGAQSETGVKNNEVVINNSDIDIGNILIYGARTQNGVAAYNKVTIDRMNTTSASNGYNIIYGAIANNKEDNISFSNNSVKISNSNIGKSANKPMNQIYGVRIYDNGTNNNISNNSVIIEKTTIADRSNSNGTEIIGAYVSGNEKTTVTDNTVTLTGVTANSAKIYGASNGYSDAVIKDNTVTITGDKTTGDKTEITGNSNIYGGYNGGEGSVIGNTVDIQSGSKIEGNVYGGYSEISINRYSGEVSGNTIKLRAGANVEKADLYGANDDVVQKGLASNNSLDIDGFSGTVNSLKNFNNLNFNNVSFDSDIKIEANTLSVLSQATINVISHGENTEIYDEGTTTTGNIITLKKIKVEKDAAGLNNAYGDFIKETDNGVQVNRLKVDTAYDQNTNETTVKAEVAKNILAGSYTNKFNTYGTTNGVLTLDGNVSSNASIIAGSYSSDADKNATGGNVVIDGNFTPNKTNEIYAGYSENGGEVSDNKITINSGIDAKELDLVGKNNTSYGSNNNLDVNGKNVAVGSVKNFDNINLNNIEWEDKGTVLAIDNGKDSDLKNTNINVNSLNLQGGKPLKVNDSMNLISGKDLAIDKGKVNVGQNFTAGVATVGEGEAIVNDDGLSYKINELAVNPQTNLIAENRAVATAFINQGSDLISSGLDSLHDQYGYGFKTFAAVYGNRSTYDAGSDLKINGWSEIIGLGSTKRMNDGDLDWGLFYENGSGNYRTYNQFNDEFFRGDGSMVYNGGGVATRFTKDNGWYYEGSLRAGTLKSEIDHALKDGMGNTYGYKSDTTYYGAHLGVGKITPLSDSQDLNVYGKYFHTYNDGDDFTIAGDRFSFDSVTSDRIMLGAKITTNKDNIWQTHYGLAWEYEFNGDSDMTAGQFNLPTQSLKGSTFIGEIGFSYRDDKFSPWSFDLDFKGYQGQRDGFSGHAQATYNF